MNYGQSGWRLCRRCEGMFFAGNKTLGVCPRDGAEHDGSESGGYILHFIGDLPRGQSGWRWSSRSGSYAIVRTYRSAG